MSIMYANESQLIHWGKGICARDANYCNLKTFTMCDAAVRFARSAYATNSFASFFSKRNSNIKYDRTLTFMTRNVKDALMHA